MGSGFIRKKVHSLTLGERLKKIRSDRRVSIGEIAKSTKIQTRYLEYLEDGHYDKLPADVYVRGFLRHYAQFFDLAPETFIRLYERERGIQQNITQGKGAESIYQRQWFSRLVITPKILVACGITILIVGGVIYFYREFNAFTASPLLVIMEPQDGITIEQSEIVVRGRTDQDAQVFLNDQAVLVGVDGVFSQQVDLHSGVNIITIKSISRFQKKETTRSVTIQANFFVQEAAAPTVPQTFVQNGSAEDGVTVEISVIPDPTWLSVEVDGQVVYSGTLLPNIQQAFHGTETVMVTSGKGSQTHVKVNGEDRGVLSDDPGIVRDVIFVAQEKK